jgi:hypothetical protein
MSCALSLKERASRAKNNFVQIKLRNAGIFLDRLCLLACDLRPPILKSSAPKYQRSLYATLHEIAKQQKSRTPHVMMLISVTEGPMANKQSIQDIDAALDRWHAKLNMAVRKINELRDKRKKLIKGYIKSPEPKGVKVMLSKSGSFNHADFDDVVPSFGNTAAIE